MIAVAQPMHRTAQHQPTHRELQSRNNKLQIATNSSSKKCTLDSKVFCEPSRQELLLARQASDYYCKNRLEKCQAALNWLAVCNGNQPALLINKALLVFVINGGASLDAFHRSLKLAAAATSSKSIEKLLLHEFDAQQASSHDADEVFDPVFSALIYNCALVEHYQRRHYKARRLLEVALSLTSPDNRLGRAVRLLLLDNLLNQLCRPEAAMELLDDSERSANWCIMAKLPKQAAILKAMVEFACLKNNNLSSKIATDADVDSIDAGSAGDEGELNLYRLALADARIEAALQLNDFDNAASLMDAMEKDVKLIGLNGTSMLSHLQRLLERRAQLYYLTNDNAKSASHLRDVLVEVPDCLTARNNLACVCMRLGKYNLANQYLRSALLANSKNCSELIRLAEQEQLPQQADKLVIASASTAANKELLVTGRHHELMLNLGLALLFSGKPAQAFDCILELANANPGNPRLWLRLAECCVQHNLHLDAGTANSNSKLQSIGSGRHRKLILGSFEPASRGLFNSASSAMPAPTIEFAWLCAENALTLLPNEPADLAANADYATCLTAWAESVSLPLSPGRGTLRGRALLEFRCSAMTIAAYSALRLCDFVQAAAICRQLLKQPCLSDSQASLCRSYLAQALANLQISNDAQTAGHLSEAISLLKSNCAQTVVENSHRYNLALVYTLDGNLSSAWHFLKLASAGVAKQMPDRLRLLRAYLVFAQKRQDFVARALRCAEPIK